MKRSLAVLLCLLLMSAVFPASAAAGSGEEIIILYENDVHCVLEGYSKLSAMKKELAQTHEYVGVVSSGDYVQGNSLGMLSRGWYIIELMNLVGYDALTLGNHEFDYHMPRLDELVEGLDTKPVCCNFQKVGDDASYFEPYRMVSYGDTDVAYIGITTPSTITSSSPGDFIDENGDMIYTFHADALCRVVQEAIDAAKEEGADHIIALSHVGDNEEIYVIDKLVAGVEGLDVVLDAHSHSVIEQRMLTDKSGREVLLTSTGTGFEYIGKLTIANGGFTTELIKTEDYPATDPVIDAKLDAIQREFAQLAGRKIGVAGMDLITHDEAGNRLVRVQETNLGDFCADAFRVVMGSDISYFNGGGLRADIKAGDIAFSDILNVAPFGNQPVVARVKGQVIHDMLEMVMRNWPEEDGGFPHVSGITFSVNTAMPSSVTIDMNELFTGVNGPYRVYDVRVYDAETGVYEPLDPEGYYTIAGQNHHILDAGGGLNMFYGAEILRGPDRLDVEVLEEYITEHLGGIIGEEYATVTPNITFTEGFQTEEISPADRSTALWLTGLGSVCVLALAAFIQKKNDSRE